MFLSVIYTINEIKAKKKTPKMDQSSYFVTTLQSKSKLFSAFAAPKFGNYK